MNTTVIESIDSNYPEVLQSRPVSKRFPRIWAIGNLGILERPLLGFFCSQRCPGEVILRTYDLVRALRDAGIPVIGGFHASMERECLDLLLRGEQPIVVCPARGIEGMRLPAAWREPLAEERLLVLSPFEAKHRRPTVELAEKRNHLVAMLADGIFVAHAAPGSKTEALCLEVVEQGKRIYTLNIAENARLAQCGIVGNSVGDLVETITHI